uniref:Protein suppressor of white apricot n=1 Tax=Cacopsylla melanoneura TaxID=428564 RepID=A0A8D9EMV9_9HEMI
MAHNKLRRGEQNVGELLVFGYSCKLFRDDEKALYIDQGKHLIPWMGDDAVKIDRYDGRGALYDLKQHEPVAGDYNALMSLTNEERKIEQLCDAERYYALNTNEDVDLLYQEEELKRIQQAGKDKKYGQVGFTYEDDGSNEQPDDKSDEAEEDDVFSPDMVPAQLDMPINTVLPISKKLFAIIEKTALFIHSQGAQMEILLKMKQASNPQFGFLSFDNPLYPFYRHVLSAIQSGRYVPTSRDEKKTNTVDHNSSTEQDEYLHPSLQVPTVVSLPESVSIIIFSTFILI